MSMKECSRKNENEVETCTANGRPCAGGLERSEGVSRRLRSVKDARVKVVVPTEKPLRTFDPTAWYIAEVKRHSELTCRNILNKPENFDYQVESYVATQAVLGRRPETSESGIVYKEKVVIHGKIFIRVAEEHRIDVLQKCLLLTRYVKDPSLELTPHHFTAFARVPDKQILRLRELLKMADGPVVYDEIVPQAHDNIQIIGGQLAKGKLFRDVKGEITQTDGRKYATVILDGIGCIKFKLRVKDIAKL